MNLSMKQKQTHKHREYVVVAKREEEWRRNGLGIWGSQMQTITYRMDKQQGLTLYSTGNYILVINQNGKGYLKEHIYVYESFCCTAEIDTTLKVNKKRLNKY